MLFRSPSELMEHQSESNSPLRGSIQPSCTAPISTIAPLTLRSCSNPHQLCPLAGKRPIPSEDHKPNEAPNAKRSKNFMKVNGRWKCDEHQRFLEGIHNGKN